MAMETTNECVRIGILGFGTVGTGVYQIITNDTDSIQHREKIELSVKRILIRGYDCEPNIDQAPRELFALSIDDIINDKDISIVVECMGGVEPARTFILKALAAGKSVVTSNKEVIAKHWAELEEAAKASGAGLYIEATAGGGMPVVRMLLDSMQANNIQSIMGIVNGTTNYILTKMSEEGKNYADVLKEAQQLGYAEANPAADVEGWDCVYKLSILGSIAFHGRVTIDAIYREGITGITAEDIELAKDMGYVIKLLAIGKKSEQGMQVRVHPTMLPLTHPLASVRGVFNAVFLTGNNVDDIMIYGRGAGKMPTASAIVSDVIYACHEGGKHKYNTFKNTTEIMPETRIQKDWETEYFIRIAVADKPGVLSKISGKFAEHGVSLHSVLQRGDISGDEAAIVFITHIAHELAVQKAIDDIRGLDIVKAVKSVIRVER